jgi:polyhydroxyalkanoate synthase subunit PhaC
MTAPAPSRVPARGPAMGTPTPLATFGLDVLDDLRRSAGRLLDTLGHAPRTTPSAVVDLAPGVRLHTYPDADPSGPPVLLVPAPIKRCYIFDLDPRCSVVARCLRHGLQPHLVEWTDPEPDQQRLGLDDYADGLLRHCLRAVADRTGARRVPLVGHSLGGTLAALCAAGYPDLVAGVALLEAPLHFGSHTGRLATLITTPTPGPTTGILDAFPNGVPGSLLTLAAAAAAPTEFHLDRWTDLLGCLPDPEALATYLRVLRWTLDEFRQPRQLFLDVVERLYRRDEFFTGTLTLAGRTLGPADLIVPMLTVVNPRSPIVPPSAVLPVHHAVATTDKQILQYRGDTGVVIQHLGVLVGRNAHRHLWPQILDWLQAATSTPGRRGAARLVVGVALTSTTCPKPTSSSRTRSL